MKIAALLLIILFCLGCGFGAGTLGGFDERVFPVSKQRLAKAIDSLYKVSPDYKIPSKWQHLDDWHERGYDFLDSRIFYFKIKPEEMYYISFIGMPEDSELNNRSATIAVRAVCDGKGWSLEENTGWSEKRRIEDRFDREIIAKLEQYTGAKAKREK
jgi:hypothetical protein